MTVEPVPQSITSHPNVDDWLDFGKDGAILLRSGKVEIGQGISTALIQLAADELDVTPERITLVAGDTRSTPNEGITSGSQSIEVGGRAIRLASSAARHVLLEEAAKLLQASVDELAVRDGLVHIAEQPTDLSYWSLSKSVDLSQAVMDKADPKSPSARRLAGQSLARRDLPAKVRGGGSFIHDLTLPDMLHGRVLHPPSLSTKLEGFDEAGLAQNPDVMHVVRDGAFIGIIAGREDAALRAIQRAERFVKWSPGGAAPDNLIEAIAATTAPPEQTHLSGDPAQIQGRTMSTTVSRQHLAHGSIGPSCAIAQWDGGRLKIHTHSQGVFPLRTALAMALRLDADAIDIIHVPGAGCYGHNGADDVVLDAALLARAVPGRPVRLVWSRADELACSPLGSAMVTKAVATLDSHDRIAALTVDVASMPHGRRPGRDGGPNLLAAEYFADPMPAPPSSDVPPSRGGGADRNSVPLYTIPNVATCKRVDQNLPYRTSSMRGLGGFINVFALETLMDDIAAEIGKDPLDFRLEHLDDPRGRAVIEKVVSTAGWPGPAAEGCGRGLAFARYKNRAAYCAVIVDLSVSEDIRLNKVWAAVDTGEVINPDGVINQIEGGIIQSASWTLKEAVKFDGDVVTSRDWESYPIMKFSEVPDIHVDIINRPEERTLGVGEAAQGPTAAAIGNAVYRALGVRIRNLPLTRDAIVEAIG